MRSVLPERRRVNGHTLIEGAIADTHRAMLSQLGQEIGERISAAAEHVLGRAPYVRRGHVPYSIEQTRACPKCRSVQSQRFSRNGSRRRQLLTRWGEVPLRWPRFVCECGGSITLDLADWLRPYQRIGSDVDAQIQRWGALSVSLRGMQGELAHSYMGVLGQRTLLQRLHQLQNLTPGADERPTPPILQLDAIWFTQLCATGQWRTDAKGRRRPVKSRRKRCLLIALGVWPARDYQEVLAWHLADGEDTASWLTFLSQLEEQGLRGENGLELIIHDGGSGLCAALTTIHFAAAEQRCLFHKLRNIWQAIRLADDLSAARTQTPAPPHLPRLCRHLPGAAAQHRFAPRPQGRAAIPPLPTRGCGHPAPRLSRHARLLHDSGTPPYLAPRVPAYHQSPRTLQPTLAPPHPQCECLSFRRRGLGHDRPGG